jgi:two-component system cell cycle response regulator DivK
MVLWTLDLFSVIMAATRTRQYEHFSPSHGRKLQEMHENCKILYIEDNRDNRILVRRVLEAEGYQVLEAADGPSGVEIAMAAGPALILMDINLPKVDGFQVTAQLKAMEELRDVPIIAVTANVMKGDREKTLEAGCSGYIQKPIDIDLLPAQLAAFLR